jgi:hypothetical protein
VQVRYEKYQYFKQYNQKTGLREEKARNEKGIRQGGQNPPAFCTIYSSSPDFNGFAASPASSQNQGQARMAL